MTGQGVSDTLRDIAEWLDANPDLEAESAYLYVRARTRTDLERIAAALGDDAIERVEGGYLTVAVDLDLPRVKVSSSCCGVHVTQRDIGGREVRAPVEYEYEPIIARVEP